MTDSAPFQTLAVQGMTCGHCEKAVTQAIRAVDPQAEVRIDRSAERVEVKSSAARQALVDAVVEEGYAAQ